MSALDPAIRDEAAAARVRAGLDYLRLQRAGLRHFRQLTAETVEPQEAQLAQVRRDAEAAAGRERQAVLAETDARRDAECQQAEATRESLEAAIHEQFQASTAELQRNRDALRARATGRCNEIAAEARGERDERVLMAETVAPATIEGLAAELRRDERKLADQEQYRQGIGEYLAALCARYGVTATAVGAPDAADAPEGAEPESVVALRARCDQAVHSLERLTLARLMSGATPWLLGAVIVVLFVTAVVLLAQFAVTLPVSGFSAALLAAGGAAVILLLVGRSLSAAAHRQAQASATWAAEALERMRVAIERDLAAARARFQQAEAQVIAQRDAEINQANDNYERATGQAAQQRDAAFERIEAEFRAKQARLEQQRDARLAEAQRRCEQTRQQALQTHEAAVQRVEAVYAERLARAQAEWEAARQQLQQGWDAGSAALGALLEAAERLPLPRFDWDSPGHEAPLIQPPADFVANVPVAWLKLRLDELADAVRGSAKLPSPGNGALRLPAILALPTAASLLIEAPRTARRRALDLLRAVIVRILTSVAPGHARLTIFDPVGLGENFAGLMHLADHEEALVGGRIWTEPEHIDSRLADLTAHMETVIQKYLRNEFETIAAYNAQAGELAEPYRFLVIADYPAAFSETSLQRLLSIVRSGPRCGVFTLVACDADRRPDQTAHWDELRDASLHVAFDGQTLRFADPALRPFDLEPEPPPTQERLTEIMHAVGRAAKDNLRVEVPFESITPAPERQWTGDSSAELEAPIGRSGAVRLQRLRLGRGLAQHALVAGKTGSGKSTLLHVLITNLALAYSPRELELYLVDFKKGVEFKTYVTHRLPHARAIAIESDREFGLSVLQRIDAEMHRRGELFRAAGVQDLAAYRAGGKRSLPRTLLIVDEFQVFFGEDDRLAQDAATLLDRLVRQGRAFGIHVLLGSQTLAGNVALTRSTLGQMAVRIALQCSEADAQLILDDTNPAARLLTRPGEAIYNDSGGLVEGNSPFQTAWLPDEQRAGLLSRVRQLADEHGVRTPAPIVFEGNAPADIRANPQLAALLDAPPPDDQPPRAWLGEPVAIKDPAHVVLRRQPGAHLLIAGQQERAAMAVLTGAMVSLAAHRRDGQMRFLILDGSPEDQQAASPLALAGRALPHEARLLAYRDVSDQINELARLVQARIDGQTDADDRRSVVLVIYGLQRYRALRRSEDDFAFSTGDDDAAPRPDRSLALILREGPTFGVHVLAWCDTVANLERTLDRGSLREFDNRLLFQMSATDSSHLIDTPEANRLGPYRALLFSEERGVMEKLRPYDVPDPAWLTQAGERLRNR